MIEKIKDFFKKLFGINTIKYLEAPKKEVLPNEIFQTNNMKLQYNDFQEQIRIDQDEEKEKALKLQNDYKSGIIKEEDLGEEDLGEEDFNILSRLYETQIKNTKESIENYKNKILNIRNKLAQNGL